MTEKAMYNKAFLKFASAMTRSFQDRLVMIDSVSLRILSAKVTETATIEPEPKYIEETVQEIWWNHCSTVCAHLSTKNFFRFILKKFSKNNFCFFEERLDFSFSIWYHGKAFMSSLERWLSWSKAHDWKSCVRLITDRGFESLSLRHQDTRKRSV